MTNAQSLGIKKFEDIDVVFEQNNVAGVVTESLFKNDMPVNQLNISNYTFSPSLGKIKDGGGVAIYVKEDVPASPIANLAVPPELECLWISCVHHN